MERYKTFLKTIAVLLLVILNSRGMGQDSNKNSIIECGCTCQAVLRMNITCEKGCVAEELRWKDVLIYDEGILQQIVSFSIESKDTERNSASFTIAYTPEIKEYDGKYRKLRVVLDPKYKRKYKITGLPKGYYAIAKDGPCKDVLDPEDVKTTKPPNRDLHF